MMGKLIGIAIIATMIAIGFIQISPETYAEYRLILASGLGLGIGTGIGIIFLNISRL